MRKKPSGNPKNCYLDPKSPYWQFDFTINGERDYGSTRCTTAREATAFVDGRRAAMRQRQSAAGVTGTKKKLPITVDAACKLYGKKATDPTTSYQLAYLIAVLCAGDAQRLVSEVTKGDLLRYRLLRCSMTNIRGKLNSGASINREIELARRVWRYAASHDFDIGQEPKWSELLDKDAEIERVRELEIDEEERLFGALSSINIDLRIMAEFSMLSGQRKKAVVGLRWDDVDLIGKKAKVFLKTRGQAKREHSFPLTPRMIDLILSRPKVGDYVFTYECRRSAPSRADRPRRLAGERYAFTSQGWSRQWRKALEVAGVTNFRWHDLRHTAATRLLRRVNNLKAAQVLLGHKTIDQTARYAHVFDDDLRMMMEQSDQHQAARVERSRELHAQIARAA